jgi:hypothetical protein
MFRTSLAVLLILTLTLNVIATPADKNKDKDKSAAPPLPITTRVYLRRQCLLGEPDDKSEMKDDNKRALFAAIAGIFIPLLLEKLLGGIGGALKKAGSEETLKDYGRRPTYVYHFTRNKKIVLNPDLKCVIVVRGEFSEPDPDKDPKIVFSEKGVFDHATPEEEIKRVKRLNENGIKVKEIAAVYEAEIMPADDHTALRYEPKFFEVRKFQGQRNSDKRGMVVSVGMIGVGEREGEPVLSLALMNLGEVTVHEDKNQSKSTFTVIGPKELKSKQSSWVGGLGINEASLKAVETLDFPANPTDPKDPEYKEFLGVMPVTVEGTFIETENGNKTLKFIGELLDATKKDVAGVLSGEILKDRDKAAADAADALEKLRQEERSTFADYLEAEAESTKANGGANNEEKTFRAFEAKRKKALWCGKYLALGKLEQTPTGRPACTADVLKP